MDEGDQLLAINGAPLDSAIAPAEAVRLLQSAEGQVELVVAKSKLTGRPAVVSDSAAEDARSSAQANSDAGSAANMVSALS